MKRQCKFITQKGTQCQAKASSGMSLCRRHSALVSYGNGKFFCGCATHVYTYEEDGCLGCANAARLNAERATKAIRSVS
jgi:hypothetical protein